MSAKVTYNGEYLIPVSTINFDLNIERAENCDVLDANYSIVIDGYLLAQKGSPQSGGNFGNFGNSICEDIDQTGWTSSILSKYCALECLFADDYKLLCWGNEGGKVLEAYPKLISMSLDTSENPQYGRYTINLEAPDVGCCGASIKPSGTECIASYDESWGFTAIRDAVYQVANSGPQTQITDNRIFEVSHDISANGKPLMQSGVVQKTAVECAKDFVCSRASFGSPIDIPATCGIPYGSGDKFRNYNDSHTINNVAGSYSISESWTFAPQDYIDSYTFSIDNSESDGCISVSIDGDISGYDCRVNGVLQETGFGNATNHYDSLVIADSFKNRCQAVAPSGITLDDRLISSSIGLNPNTGNVSYSYQFKQRPIKEVTNAKFESISFASNWEEDIVNRTNLLGRGEYVDKANGAGFYAAASSSLTIDLVYPCELGIGNFGPRFDAGEAAEIQAIVDSYHPSNLTGVFGNICVESQSESWEKNSGSYNYSVTWVASYSGVCG